MGVSWTGESSPKPFLSDRFSNNVSLACFQLPDEAAVRALYPEHAYTYEN
jgi:hypothetical protein